jgi:hypothetical protein
MGWALDLGLPAGLLLVLLAVLAVDRFISRNITAQALRVEVVFVLDQGPAMAGVVDAMKTNCLEKAAGLHAGGLDCRFAVVPFGRGANKIPAIPLTSDLPGFKQRLLETPAASQTPPAESNAAALQQALRMDFRPDASVFLFLITNTPCQRGEDLAGIAGQMNQRGIRAIIQADAAEQDVYRLLYQDGGRFFTMEGEDVTGPIVASSEGDKAGSRAVNLLASLTAQSGSGDPSALMGAKGLYGLRTLGNRQRWVGLYGGTANSELAVQEGLNWLARHQAPDGHWDNDCVAARPGGCCEENSTCSTSGEAHAMAHTGLALLAFQAGGHYYFNGQKYSDVVRRGLEWLVERQQQDGGLYGAFNMYEHGMATFSLADACATAVTAQQDVDSRYRAAAEKAVRFIETHQKQDGGWRYSPDRYETSDTSVSGWQVLALEAAKEAKIEVGSSCLANAIAYFKTCQIGESGRTGYQRGNQITEATTGVGMLVHAFLLGTPDDEWCRQGAEHLAKLAERQWGQRRSGPKDYYLWYNCTLAMCQHGGEPWKRWNDVVREHVLSLQNKDRRACLRGSWDWQGDRWGGEGGRVYTTALATLMLEVYYRYSSDRAKVYGEQPKPAPAGKGAGESPPKQ